MSIYQEIWDADQSGNGIKPILAGTAPPAGLADTGFVQVLARRGEMDGATRLLPEVVIPQHKRVTYDRVRALFDNYALDERHAEVETQDERAEVHELLEAIVDTAPMQVARAYVSAETGRLTSVRTGTWRLYDFFWGLHIMDWTEHERFNTPWLMAFAAGGLVFGVAGAILLFMRWPRRRRRKVQGTARTAA